MPYSMLYTLQMKDLSACEAQKIAAMTVKTFDSIRNDDSFCLFWKNVVVDSQRVRGKEESPAPRIVCFSGTTQGEFPTTLGDHYRTVYHEALDLVTSIVYQNAF